MPINIYLALLYIDISSCIVNLGEIEFNRGGDLPGDPGL